MNSHREPRDDLESKRSIADLINNVTSDTFVSDGTYSHFGFTPPSTPNSSCWDSYPSSPTLSLPTGPGIPPCAGPVHSPAEVFSHQLPEVLLNPGLPDYGIRDDWGQTLNVRMPGMAPIHYRDRSYTDLDHPILGGANFMDPSIIHAGPSLKSTQSPGRLQPHSGMPDTQFSFYSSEAEKFMQGMKQNHSPSIMTSQPPFQQWDLEGGMYDPFKSGNLSTVAAPPGDAMLKERPQPPPQATHKPLRPTYSDVLAKGSSSPSPKASSSISTSSTGQPKKPELISSGSKSRSAGNKKGKVKVTSSGTQSSSSSSGNPSIDGSPKARVRTGEGEKLEVRRKHIIEMDSEVFTNGDPMDSKPARSAGGSSSVLEKENVSQAGSVGKNKSEDGSLNNSKVTFNNQGKNIGSPQKKPLSINNNLGTTARTEEDENQEAKQRPVPVSHSEKKSGLGMDAPRRDSLNLSSRGNSRSSLFIGEKSPSPVSVTARKGSGKKKRDPHCASKSMEFLCMMMAHLWSWSLVVLAFLSWLVHLVYDVISMSFKLLIHYVEMIGEGIYGRSKAFGKWIWVWILDKGKWAWEWWQGDDASGHGELEFNIQLPSSGEEAMKRLLACKGKDPYSILGVTPTCTDEDIRRYYKRQAVLVHPDKNRQPGAEEAFKVLAHAFELIGEPARRQEYDSKRIEQSQMWQEFNDLLTKLQQKMEEAANTIRCTNCNKRHRRVKTERKSYAARYCNKCSIHHAAREGDIWAESRVFGFLWHYYACMDGAVYDITEWAGCQSENLRHLQANTHNVQYRIVSSRSKGNSGGSARDQQQRDPSSNQHGLGSDLEDFLSHLYGGNASQGTGVPGTGTGAPNATGAHRPSSGTGTGTSTKKKGRKRR